MMDDSFPLKRFLEAQAPLYPSVVAELRRGEKRSHWMWFIFPQIAGLGRSETARFYALSSLAEAKAYAADAVLFRRRRRSGDARENLNASRLKRRL